MKLGCRKVGRYGGLVGMLLLIAACGPTELQKARQGEDRRIECLDKICQGDAVPNYDLLNEVALKLNGQWYIGPKEYFSSGINGASFEWWDHKPLSRNMKRPPEVKALALAGKGYDISIEIFLRHHDGVMHGLSRYDRLRQAEEEGRLISKTTVKPGLEFWRTRETDGLGPGVWYVAINHVNQAPDAAVLSCRESDPQSDRCVTGFVWQSGIASDLRFQAKHSIDWLEIYQETVRILQLLKKV